MMSTSTTPPPSSVEAEILERFAKAAVNPERLFAYPTGRDGLLQLGYDANFIASLPDAVAQCYCGVGNPFAPGLPCKGWSVLDVGCGAGVDALAASQAVGEGGQVTGVELSPAMLARAAANLRLCNTRTVSLRQAGAEALPFPDCSFDMLISNGVYNLVPDKPRALAEAFRVLKPGGVVQLADQILDSDHPPACPLPAPGSRQQASNWAR